MRTYLSVRNPVIFFLLHNFMKSMRFIDISMKTLRYFQCKKLNNYNNTKDFDNFTFAGNIYIIIAENEKRNGQTLQHHG